MDFYNKNQYRKYPFTQDSTLGSVPDSAVVGLRVEQCGAKIRSAYCTNVRCIDGVFSMQLWGVDTNGFPWAIGAFSAKPTKSFQYVPITTTAPCFASGYLVLGDIAVFGSNFEEKLGAGIGDIETTCVGYYERPLVHNINTYPHTVAAIPKFKKQTTGNVVLKLTGLEHTRSTNTMTFTTDNVNRITPDKPQGSCLDDCTTPVIYRINDITVDGGGGITFDGDDPFTVTTSGSTITIGVTESSTLFPSGFSRSQLCIDNNKIPHNTSDAYYADVFTTTDPEWTTWPEYTPAT